MFFLNERTDTFGVQAVPPDRPHELPPRSFAPETAPPPHPDIPSSPLPTGKTNVSPSIPSSTASEISILTPQAPLLS